MTDRSSDVDREARALRWLLGLGCLPLVLLPLVFAGLVINAATQPTPTLTPSPTPFFRTPAGPTVDILATWRVMLTVSMPTPTFWMPGQTPATPTLSPVPTASATPDARHGRRAVKTVLK